MEFLDLIQDYLDDANQHLSSYDGALLTIERDGFNRDVIMNTLGSLHTMKGNSGMMGYESLKQYIHQVEELLKRVLDGDLKLDTVTDGLLDSANVLREALINIEKNPSSQPDLTKAIIELKRIAEGDGGNGGGTVMSVDSYLGARTDTIKVDFKKLDDLLNLVGELVIFKTRLSQIELRLKPVLDDKAMLKDLGEGIQLIGNAVSELQEDIMQVRMLPVRTVFNKFTRMVRDIAKSQGKNVEIIFEGSDTELDKTVIDELAEPLLHIVKNAVDHGIETMEERGNAGKKYSGTIKMKALQESNYVIIRVDDDGRGIDPEAVRLKAVKSGLISEDDVLSENDILNLIFAPGFSMKEDATEISGRGVGLDVVNRNIIKLNGQVVVKSKPGAGSSFEIKLPLSLAIIPALMAESAGEVYAIPLSAVVESVKVKATDLTMVNNREVVRLRGSVLPVVRLNRFFNLGGEDTPTFYLVVVGKGEKKLALAVDSLKGQQEIVIKPLDDMLGKSFGIAGASILGDGKIVLIVDVLAFWNSGGNGKKAGEGLSARDNENLIKIPRIING